jgi:16S rRNA (uracil1498-N3)-methyltransferase
MDLIFTDLNSKTNKLDLKKLTNKPSCIIVGPEGDFSETEREEILSIKVFRLLKLMKIFLDLKLQLFRSINHKLRN